MKARNPGPPLVRAESVDADAVQVEHDAVLAVNALLGLLAVPPAGHAVLSLGGEPVSPGVLVDDRVNVRLMDFGGRRSGVRVFE